jgi:hypothetical protein
MMAILAFCASLHRTLEGGLPHTATHAGGGADRVATRPATRRANRGIAHDNAILGGHGPNAFAERRTTVGSLETASVNGERNLATRHDSRRAINNARRDALSGHLVKHGSPYLVARCGGDSLVPRRRSGARGDCATRQQAKNQETTHSSLCIGPPSWQTQKSAEASASSARAGR